MLNQGFVRLLRAAAFTVPCLYFVTLLDGCGGSSQPIGITITSSASTVDPSDSATLTAAVTNDNNNDGVTWTVTGGGTLSNTTTSSATFTAPSASASGPSGLTVTVTATSVADTSKTATTSITVPPPPSITTTTLPPAVVGTAFSETLAVSGGISPYTWKLSSGSLPACLTLSSAGSLSGTPVASCAGTYNVTFEVTDSGKPAALTATERLTIVINGAPAIVLPAPATLAAAVYNVAYTGSVAATGGSGALTYTATGSLPTGLSLNGSTGAITGTPTTGGAFNFTIKAADAFGDSASQAYSISVTYPALAITTASLPAGLYNSTYGPANLAATGGSGSAANLSWTWAAASGSSLPTGLSLSSGGVISGKPTITGTFSVVVTATDSVSKSSANATLSVAITYPALSITTSSLPNGVLNAVYPNTTLAATGGTGSSANYTWSWTAASGSSLPVGLNLSPAGLISGTPTAGGSFSIVLKVEDTVANASATATLGLAVTYPTLSITTTSLPNGVLNAVYAPLTLAASGGSDNLANYEWSWAAASGSSLPAGISLSSAGVISGTPTAGGSFSVVVTVKDLVSNTTANATLALTVTYPALTITTSALPNGILNTAYSAYTLAATGGSDKTANYTWTWTAASGSSLPPGMALSSAGVLTGTPTSGGSFSVVVTVSDSVSKTTGQANLTFTVGFTTLLISTKTLPAGNYNAAYGPVSLTATGGSGNSSNYTWTWAAAPASSLPGGLSLSSAGAITGTPTATGSFSVVVTVSDSVSKTNTQATLSLSITYAALSITTTALPNGLLNAVYTPVALAATGGSNSSANYTWSWTAAGGSSLPAGLNLSAAGVISGTPTAGGSFSVVIKVADSVSNTSTTATLPITITYPALAITTKSIPNGVLNAVYTPLTFAATGGSDNSANDTWSWAAASGSSLPAGLSLSAAGILSGTPTAGGSFSVVITVADSVSKTNASVTLPITVTYPALSITTTLLPNGLLNAVYSPVTLTATGGSDKTANYSWTWAAASGSSLPAGLSLSTAGVLSGTPTAGGSFSVVITVADSVSKTNASTTLPITITYPALAITTSSLPNGLLNSAYSPVTFVATGGSGVSSNYSWNWAAAPTSTLPTGMSFSSAGVLSGTPTAGGAFSIVFTVSDSVSKTNASVTLPLTITYPALSITTIALPSGTLNTAYGPAVLAATGGSGLTSNYSWSWAAAPASSLPTGLTLSAAGSIAGTPTATGTFSVVLTVNDSVSKTSANKTLSITVNASLSITTTTLPSATTNAAYSQQLASTGGSGGNTWSTTGASNLSTFNLTLSAAGLITGTPATTGTASFTAQVKDSSGDVATQPLTIAVYSALALSPATLPAGNVGLAYNETIAGSGGSGNYCYIVPTILTQASLLDGLYLPAPNSTSCGSVTAPTGYSFYVGSSLNLSGTPSNPPTPPYSISFSTTLIDLTTGISIPRSYSISITAPPALSLPTPNPVTLPAATVNAAYTGSINATGGVGTYTWTVNSTVLTSGSSTNLGNGTLLATANGSVLNISGTPSTVTTTPVSIVASISDSASQSAGPETYTLAVDSPSAAVSGQIMLGNCGGTVPSITLTINTSSPLTTTTDSNGNFSFPTVPNGNWTITPSISGPESVFYPATIPISVNGNPLTEENFTAALGYTVSGNLAYSGAKTGQVYVALSSTNCGSNAQGTSITDATLKAGGAFTIRGVPPGSYTLFAWMDTIGQGARNASDPASSSTSETVANANLTGQAVTLTDPAAITLSSAPSIQGVSPASETALVSFGGVPNINGAEAASSYTLQWSTSSTFASVTGSETLTAVGTGGAQIWFVSGLTNGTKYYFRVQGVAGSSTSPFSSIYGPVTINALTGGNAVSGTVTFSETATGPLYVGFYNTSTGEVYSTVVGSKTSPPTSPAAYTVSVPTGSAYYFFGIIDQNNDNQVDAGDISNTNFINTFTTISGAVTGEDLTLPSGNSAVQLTTQAQQNTINGTTYNQYNLAFKIQAVAKLPVAVTLASGANVLVPADYGLCTDCGNSGEFNFYVPFYSVAPVTGNPYGVQITYSDGTSETLTPTVGTILKAYATNLLPDSTGASVTPTFTWTDPASASDYTYQFTLTDQNGNNIWEIPGQNSSSNGFGSTVTSITYGTDPTGGGSAPTLTQLAAGTTYTWQIQVDDANRNQATTQVQFTTAGTAALTLPTPDPSSLGSATVGQPYNGSIAATGGVANYTWTVNGTAVNPSGCTLFSIGNGLSVCNSNGSSTLSVVGTPASAVTVSFTASITDSTNTTDTNGTLTYTINVGSSSTITLPDPASNAGSALVGYAYGESLSASGGTGSGYVFTLNGTALPTNGTLVSIGEGLSASSTGGAEFSLSGMPTTATPVTFTLSVKDSANDDAGPDTYTVNISNPPSGTNDSNLSGQYVCSAGGYVDSDSTLWKTMFSLQANGSAGTFTSGVFDSNGTDYTAAQTGTVTGGFNIGSDNNGVANLAFNPTGGSSFTSRWAIALTNSVEPAQEFRMVEIDDVGASPSGRQGQADCYLATTSAFTSTTVSGHNFVFLANGESSTPAPRTGVGRFSALNGSITGGVLDQATGIPASVTTGTFTGGSYTLPTSPSFASSGRYLLTLTTSSGSAGFVVYVINSARMFMLRTDTASGSFGGDVRTQQQTTYSAANLNGNMVFYFQGLDASGGALSGYNSSIFQASGNGAGNIVVNVSYQDDNGTYAVGAADATYPVTFDASNAGRVTFVPGSGTGYLYLYNNNAAGLLVVDGSGDLYGGFIDPQTQTTFTDAALAGNYMVGGFPPLKPKDISVGEIDLSGTGTVTGSISTGGKNAFTWDDPQASLTNSWLSTTYGSISVADSGNPNSTCIVISSTKYVCIQNTKSTPNLQVFQQ